MPKNLDIILRLYYNDEKPARCIQDARQGLIMSFEVKCMLNLAIMPLDPNPEHIDEVCQEIIRQQREGAISHAMFMMEFAAEGTPPVNRAEQFCRIYDQYRERLDAAGAKHGVLVQSTMGHIYPPATPNPFQRTVGLHTGETITPICCPLDKGFQDYMREQMHILATHKPSLIMIDDDVGLLYRSRLLGCGCPLHVAEFNRRAGTNFTREEIYAQTQGNSEENKKYTQMYIDMIGDSLVEVVRAMREGIDEVDPTIQGLVSGIMLVSFCEFSDRVAGAFAGKGNPTMARLNCGMYTSSGGRGFTARMYRAATLREYCADKVQVWLAETDTCPQNRYSTSASLLHSHYAAIILEGAKGAKHWITRLHAHELDAGKAYAKILAKNKGFYEALADYYEELVPFGCRIPTPKTFMDYGFVPAKRSINISPWSTCVLERLGLPLFFGARGEGAVFLSDLSVDDFTDAEVKEFFKGTLFLSAVAADKLTARGFGDLIGVKTAPWEGKTAKLEVVDGHFQQLQVDYCQLIPTKEGVEEIGYAVFSGNLGVYERIFTTVTSYKHAEGGRTVVFGGNPDTNFTYFEAFSFLCESRKRQIAKILAADGHLPVCYTEDADVYVRAGYLKNGEMLCAVFNLSLDVLEDIPLYCRDKVNKVEMLNPDGSRSAVAFDVNGNIIRVKKEAGVLDPVVLFLS